jgi:hypothetical protein
MVYIYILKLEQNKYYIGKTNNPSYRIQNHDNGNGSFWTRKYKPINIEKIIPDCDDYDEDKYVIQYMDKYGISNVRGGSFSQFILPSTTVDIIKTMCKGATNKCFKCGETGHFIKECINDPEHVPLTIDTNTKKTIKKSNAKKSANNEKTNIFYSALIYTLECCGCLK